MAHINTVNGDNITNLREYLNDEENISYHDFEQIVKTASEVLERCLEPTENGSVKGLIYGHIQSGKTSIILTTMALAADNGFNNFVVMTSNLNDIYEQTLERIKGALDSFQVFGKKEIIKNPGTTPGLPLALVCSKHPGRLGNVLDIFQSSNWQNEPVIIIDDEADQASLDTNINVQNKSTTSAVNRAIVDLRNYLNSHTYLQTTATPQALLLQDSQSAFRPDFVVITTPGTGYVGGNYFFDNNNFSNSAHIRRVPDIDLNRLRTSKRIPDTVIRSMLVFFLGAAILRIQVNSRKYTYLLHTSFRQGDHHLAAVLVDNFKNELTNQLRQNPNNPIMGLSTDLRIELQNAYDDLQQTFVTVPSFHDVLVETARRITSTEVIEINSDTGEGIGPLTRKHTLYIGGTKLGRGVTVKNLLVTYYGRDAQQPQMDTVLQHARMYGYRRNELAAIRIYLPTHLAQRFVDIHESDDLVREQCQATHLPIQLIPLMARGIKPTRRNVLNENTNRITYQGGKQYFPSLPISEPHILGNQTQELDNILSNTKYSNQQQPYTVTIDELLEILNFQYKTPESSGAWNDDLIRQAVSALRDQEKYQNIGTLVIVNRSADIGKSADRNYSQIGAVLPGNAGNAPYGINRDYPTLLMTRINGKIDPPRGWDGVPFWIPVIRFPDGNYAFSVNES